MDMGARASAAFAYKADNLVPLYCLTFLHQAFLKVAILGPEAVAMIKHYIPAVAFIVALDNDCTGSSGLDI